MELKAAHECEVFLEFAGAAALAVDQGTVETREPPEPDIRCSVEGQTIYFELGRPLDRGMQRLRFKALRGGIVTPGDEEVRLPEREMLRRKLGKSYAVFEAPVDLVLYYDNENALVGDVPVFDDRSFVWHSSHVMKPLIDGSPRTLRRVWVFERHRKTVLWRYPEDTA